MNSGFTDDERAEMLGNLRSILNAQDTLDLIAKAKLAKAELLASGGVLHSLETQDLLDELAESREELREARKMLEVACRSWESKLEALTESNRKNTELIRQLLNQPQPDPLSEEVLGF